MKLVALALAAGCGNSATVADAPAADAAPVDAFATVTGSFTIQDLRNDSQHMPIVDDRTFGSIAARVRQPDGTWADGSVAADGTFSFPLPDDRAYHLELSGDGTFPYELQLGLPHVDFPNRFQMRYERTPVPAGTTLSVSTPGAPATGTALVESTGVWAALGRANGTNSAWTLDWTPAPGLLDASANDRAYATIYTSIGSPAYSTLTAACSADVTMTGGTSTSLSCTMQPLTLDRCMHIRAHYPDEYKRLQAAVSTQIVYTGQYSWNMFGLPAPALGPAGLLVISGAAYSTFPPVLLDRDQTKYAVPFAGHSPLLVSTMQFYRTLLLPGTTTGPQISVLTQHFVLAAPDCTTPTEVFGTVGIAATPELQGSAIDFDNAAIELDRAHDIDLAWKFAAYGQVDFWQVNLYSLAQVGTATQLQLQRRWVTETTRVAIDPALLVANTSYIVLVTGYQGFPAAGAGDFRTQSFPWALSQQWSGIFRITN